MPYRKATIRPYRDEDEPLLFGLARMTFGDQEGWSDNRTIATLDSERVFVAELDAGLAGYVAIADAGDALRIDHALVSPEHEGE